MSPITWRKKNTEGRKRAVGKGRKRSKGSEKGTQPRLKKGVTTPGEGRQLGKKGGFILAWGERD